MPLFQSWANLPPFPGATRFAPLIACPWLSYFAPLVLSPLQFWTLGQSPWGKQKYMDTTELYSERFFALSTPQVSDALEPFGVVSGLIGIRPAVRGRKVFGPAFTVAKQLNDDPSFRDAADFVDDVPSGQVIVIDNLGLESSTCWGGILTHYAIRKGIRGTVINGLNRDIDEIAELDYPLFSKGSFMVTGKGRTRLKAVNVPITIE